MNRYYERRLERALELGLICPECMERHADIGRDGRAECDNCGRWGMSLERAVKATLMVRPGYYPKNA